MGSDEKVERQVLLAGMFETFGGANDVIMRNYIEALDKYSLERCRASIKHLLANWTPSFHSKRPLPAEIIANMPALENKTLMLNDAPKSFSNENREQWKQMRRDMKNIKSI